MGLFLQRNLNLFRFVSLRLFGSLNFSPTCQGEPWETEGTLHGPGVWSPWCPSWCRGHLPAETFLDVLATFSGSFSEEKCIFPRFQRENSLWLTLENHVAKALARNQVEWRPYKGKTLAFFLCSHVFTMGKKE